MTRTIKSFLAVTFTLSMCGASALAAPILFKSGQVSGVPGLPGQLDDIVTYLNGANPPGGPISMSPFTPAEFLGATTGPQAVLITPHPAWTPGISDPDARWINWGAQVGPSGAADGYGLSGSALYAVPFFVPGSGPLSATLNIEFAVDDTFGDWYSNIGGNPFSMYMNGFALSLQGGNYAVPSFYTTTVTVNGGAMNYLYLYQRDEGVIVSGTIFSGSVVVPAPGAAAALIGVGGMVMGRRRR